MIAGDIRSCGIILGPILSILLAFLSLLFPRLKTLLLSQLLPLDLLFGQKDSPTWTDSGGDFGEATMPIFCSEQNRCI